MSPVFNYVMGVALGLLGLRLLLQSIRLKKLEEGLLGAFLLLSPGGMAVAFYAVTSYRAGDSSAYSIATGAIAVTNLGTAAYYAFIWRTFRPREMLGVGLFLMGTALLAVSWYLVLWKRAYGVQLEPHPVGFAPRILAYAWGIFESARTHRLHSKRLAIGLADPVVVNRFALFVWWNLALVAPAAANAVLRRFDPTLLSTLYLTLPFLVGSGLALITVLVFFPPVAYTRYLRRNEGAGELEAEE